MTIEIHDPEIEATIERRLATGRYADLEDVVRQVLLSAPDETMTTPRAQPRRTLIEVLERGRGLGEGVDFSRDQSEPRIIEF
jgi:Arc/MetJ-type ribon-helix-helix transcriptional regulator